MRKKAVSEQDGNRVPPFRVGGRLVAPELGTIHDVVVHKRRDMDQLQNHRKVDMGLSNCSGSTCREQREGRSQPLAAGPANIGDVAFDRRVKRLRLIQNPAFNRGQVRLDQLERLGERNRLAGRHCWHGRQKEEGCLFKIMSFRWRQPSMR